MLGNFLVRFRENIANKKRGCGLFSLYQKCWQNSIFALLWVFAICGLLLLAPLSLNLANPIQCFNFNFIGSPFSYFVQVL